MDIYIWSWSAFYKEEWEIFFLEAIFAILRNNISKLLKDKSQKKEYWNWLERIIIILICDPYNNTEEEIKYWWREWQSRTVMNARKFIDGTFVERVEMMVNDIARTMKEFYRIMKTRKDKRDFDIDDFLKDLDEVKKEMFNIKEDLKKQVEERVVRIIKKDKDN